MSNLSSQLAATLQVTDTVLTPSPQDVTYSLNNPTFTGTASFFQAFFQAATTGTTVPLPMTTCPVFLVVNRDATSNLTVAYTFTGGSSETVAVLLPGGALCLFNTGTGQGVTAATLTSGGAGAIGAMVYAAG